MNQKDRPMLPIGEPQLRQLAPDETGLRRTRQAEIIHEMGGAFAATLHAYGIDTPLRAAHFLAQIAHESDGFCTTEEYASGRAYEGRADLGNVRAGDGPLFKGRGLIQLTGRVNYRAAGAKLRLDLEGKPHSVNDPVVYLLVSCVFWQSKGINAACDTDDVIAVTRLVNGGLTGLSSRIAYLAEARVIVAGAMAAQATPPAGLGVMHLGCSNSAVAGLQQALVAAGYPVGTDGEFGPATALAVKHFQSARGLQPDGLVGAATWAALHPA